MKRNNLISPSPPPALPSSPKDCVAIGQTPDGETLSLTDTQLRRHCYMIASSGSGKTELLKCMLHQHLDRGISVVALDPIGSLVPATLDRMREQALAGELRACSLPEPLAGWARRRLVQKLRRIIAIDFADPDGWRWNPLEVCDGLSPRDLGLALASAIERIVAGDMAQMRQLLQLLTCLGFVVAHAGGIVADLVALCCADTATLEDFADRVERRMAEGRLMLSVRRDILMTVFRSFFAQSSHRERRDLVASTLRALTLILSDPAAERFLSARKGNLRLSDVIEGRASVLAYSSSSNRFTVPVLFGALLDRLKTLALRRSAKAVAEGPQTIVYLDEFQTVFTPQLAQDIATLRNKKLSFVLAHQTSSQPPFHTPEGRAMLQAVRDNCSTQVWMRVGQRDAEEAAGMLFRPTGNSMVQLDRDEVTHTEGASTTRSLARSVSRSISEAFAEGDSRSVSISLGESGTISYSESRGLSRTETDSLTLTRGDAFCRAVSKTSGVSVTIAGNEVLVEGNGTSTSLSRSRGHSNSSSVGGGRSTSEGHSLPAAAPGATELAMPGGNLSSGLGETESWSCSVADSLAETIGQVVGRTASLARGRSWGQSTSRSQAVSESTTESRSRSEGHSIARGISIAQGCVESLGRTLTRGTTDSHSQTHTSTRGSSRGEAYTLAQGTSVGRSVRRLTQYYSVEDETRLRSYELMDLPTREAWIVIWGDGPAKRERIRTLDVRQTFTTSLGPLSGARILANLCPTPRIEAEPTDELLERLCNEDLARDLAAGDEGAK